MASELQIEANRKNAQHSSGPKTLAGKTKASRNALRHGLARAQNDAPATEGLLGSVRSYLGREAKQCAVVDVAVARGELTQVREVRLTMLAELLKSAGALPGKRLLSLDRYERAALAKQKWALRRL